MQVECLLLLLFQAISQGVAITMARYLEKEEHMLPQPR